MPKRDHRDLARLLVDKAAGDETALRILCAEATVPDEVIGFHAQQAVEKALKAVLSARAQRYPPTHDLGLLLTLLHEGEHHVPAELHEVELLTPWAVQLRYEATAGARLDRPGALALATLALDWARREVG